MNSLVERARLFFFFFSLRPPSAETWSVAQWCSPTAWPRWTLLPPPSCNVLGTSRTSTPLPLVEQQVAWGGDTHGQPTARKPSRVLTHHMTLTPHTPPPRPTPTRPKANAKSHLPLAV